MSENVATPETNTTPQPISFDDMKLKLIANFEMMYEQFCKQLGVIPCAQENQYPAMRHFDDGFYNFREGIRRLQLEGLIQKTQAPAPQQPAAPQEPVPTPDELPPAA